MNLHVRHIKIPNITLDMNISDKSFLKRLSLLINLNNIITTIVKNNPLSLP